MPKVQADTFLSAPSDDVVRAPAILLAGDESYLVDKALAAVLERVVTAPGSESFDLDVRDATELDPSAVDELVSTPPLMNDRRIVVLKNVAGVSAETRDALKAALERLGDGLCLIGTGPAKMRGNLYELWEKAGARVVCDLPRKSPRSKQPDFDHARWLAARARHDFGVTLEKPAAKALAETGGDLQALYGELEKVALYVGEAGTVTADDVARVCSGGAIGTVWEWCDAVGAGDADRALTLLRQLLGSGESAYRLVPLLAIHLCRLGVAAETGSGDPKAIMAALPGRSWYAMAKGLAAQARGKSPAAVAGALDLLVEADRMLKSTSHKEAFVLDRHVLEVVHAA